MLISLELPPARSSSQIPPVTSAPNLLELRSYSNIWDSPRRLAGTLTASGYLSCSARTVLAADGRARIRLRALLPHALEALGDIERFGRAGFAERFDALGAEVAGRLEA